MADGVALVASLNGDCHSAAIDREALDAALRSQGEDLFRHVTEHCPHLFAAAPLFISAAHVEQMRGVIAAVEQVVALPAWMNDVHLRAPLPNPLGETTSHSTRLQIAAVKSLVIPQAGEGAIVASSAQNNSFGVFMGYDFHLNDNGAHLIEINTNAGGAFLNALLLQSQREVAMPGKAAALDNPEQVFLDMFRNEWRLERGDAPLQTVAIVDEQPEQQYLFPEFVLARQMFERAGITALIADPDELEVRADGLYCAGQKIDLVYNRLTDFFLQQHAALGAACQSSDLAVVTPHPYAYALYADKYNLTLLTDTECLRMLGVADDAIATLQAGIPQTRVVRMEDAEHWWKERKQWFFKPVRGFGSKGTYRGDKLTKRVFDEIMQDEYVAQKIAVPCERMLCLEGIEPASLKSDVRCYVYNGQVQIIAARLYQGQATNFRTAGGGFALVRIIG